MSIPIGYNEYNEWKTGKQNLPDTVYVPGDNEDWHIDINDPGDGYLNLNLD